VGLVTWLAAMASVQVCAGLALFFLLRTVHADWSHLTIAVCREVAGTACPPDIYRSAAYELGLAVLLALASLGAAVAAWRYGRRVQRARRQTVAHGRAARIVGRELPGTGAVVLEDPRPAAYCAAKTIIVTRGALDVLDDVQLAAVLAHERAHLSGRHHALVLFARGMTAACPGVPLFGAGEREVATLAEMSADDAAVRALTSARAVTSAGRSALVAALLAIAMGQALPGGGALPRTALAAAAYAVPARVERMLRLPSRSRVAGYTLTLSVVTVALAALPAAIVALTG
jgi:beta-lactamase regulating signal transducer with metallopeptidase domain